MVSLVKAETSTFYASAIRRAVATITQHLDLALDLGGLARSAALSPLHFHRIFRGMLGETPLEVHRRLRLERAAFRLLHGDTGVTAIAFDSGYESHEAFTRAFRAAYGTPPSAFRRASPEPTPGCERPRTVELAARSGIHFRAEGTTDDFVPFISGGDTMNVAIQDMPALRLATIRHVGPYSRISEAFQRLGAIAGPAGLYRHPNVAMLAVYHDEPDVTPPDELRSDAALSVPDDAVLPEGLVEVRLPAGRYASTTHVGPYTALGDAWSRFMGEWLPKSGHRVRESASYEIYRNNPATAPERELRTELFLPVE